MKHTLFILALITASIQTFAQSPRIKLNQITKDSVTGSVLISSPTDSGMVYSRDLFISYGADTFLILGGDTLAATSSIISSVLSDGVTITGDGTLGSELTVDTATVIATKGDLSDYVTIAGTETITGAKTFSTGIVVNEDGNNVDTRFEGDTDANLLYLDANENRIGIGTSSPSEKLQVEGSAPFIRINNTSVSTLGLKISYNESDNHGLHLLYNPTDAVAYIDNTYPVSVGQVFGDIYFRQNVSGNMTTRITIKAENGNVGIGTSPSEALEVNGNILASGTITPNGSDRKLKTNISTLSSGLDVISNLIPVTYDFIQNTDKKFPIYNQVGFVAQDVQDALSGKSYINGIVIETKDYLALDYDKFSPIIVKAIQEQQTIIESQATEIETLKTLITDLSNRLQILENN